MRMTMRCAAITAFLGAVLLSWQASAEDGPSGVYRGVYVCNQGLTGATVRVCEEDGAVRIGFEFYEVAQNRGVPWGLCYLRGDFDEGARAMSAVAAGWGSKPGEDWLIAPFSGVFEEDYSGFRGFVDAEGCGVIVLERVAGEDAAGPSCAPLYG